jgi:hypothetical protein
MSEQEKQNKSIQEWFKYPLVKNLSEYKDSPEKIAEALTACVAYWERALHHSLFCDLLKDNELLPEFPMIELRTTTTHEFYINRSKQICISKFLIELIQRKIITVSANVVEQAALSFWKGPDRLVEAIIDSITGIDREAAYQEERRLSPLAP